ncbi:hypothetical protein N0V87_003281 [Didymella glomerata]|uniref:Uncharacterized protein n=1 Tax=Didymella glomerata TaxID=749621 RepID=A0A9W8X3I9_9PLEO|nr:hypothetical protein N0V87_003281 [Didymella glomerata]
MTTLSALPERFQKITTEIKEQQQLVKKLHKAEEKAYKIYVRARAKLMSKKHQDLQNNEAKKWYNFWVKSVAELQSLIDQIKQEEATLYDLEERRVDQVTQDREKFESELLQH